MKFLSGIAFSAAAASSPVAVLHDISFSSRRTRFSLAQRSAACCSFVLIAARYGFGSSNLQKSKHRILSVSNVLASEMHRSSSLSCALASKSAWNWSRLSFFDDRGAPGQSVLNSGLAISVTRSLCSSRIFFASSICLASSSVTFLLHIERSSIQRSPNSPDTIWHALSKSCVISSLITASRNGHAPGSAASATREDAPAFAIDGMIASSPASPNPASTARRVYLMPPSPLPRSQRFFRPYIICLFVVSRHPGRHRRALHSTFRYKKY